MGNRQAAKVTLELNWAQKQDEVYLMDSAGEVVLNTILKFKFLSIYDM